MFIKIAQTHLKRSLNHEIRCFVVMLHLISPLSYFSFQPVLHDWCNKGRGMYYPVCGMMHIKEPLLLIGKSSPCGGSGFPFSLSEWSFTICLTPYNRRQNVLSASLNKTFLSLSLSSYLRLVDTSARCHAISLSLQPNSLPITSGSGTTIEVDKRMRPSQVCSAAQGERPLKMFVQMDPQKKCL